MKQTPIYHINAMKQEKVLLFDGYCNLCNGISRFVIKADKKKKFKLASLQSESAQILLKRFDLPIEDFRTFVLIIGDKYFLKSTAGLMVAKVLGGFWKLFYVFILIPRPFRDFVYNIIAKNRYKIFGKRDTCAVPTAEVNDRFLP